MGKYKRGMHPNFIATRPDRSAPDSPGETIVVTTRLTPEQKAWLDSRVEGRSYHIRQAVQAYIDAISAKEKLE